MAEPISFFEFVLIVFVLFAIAFWLARSLSRMARRGKDQQPASTSTPVQLLTHPNVITPAPESAASSARTYEAESHWETTAPEPEVSDAVTSYPARVENYGPAGAESQWLNDPAVWNSISDSGSESESSGGWGSDSSSEDSSNSESW